MRHGNHQKASDLLQREQNSYVPTLERENLNVSLVFPGTSIPAAAVKPTLLHLLVERLC